MACVEDHNPSFQFMVALRSLLLVMYDLQSSYMKIKSHTLIGLSDSNEILLGCFYKAIYPLNSKILLII